MATTDVLWSAWDGLGLEHLRLDVTAAGVRADGLIVAMADGRPYRARYTIDCRPTWSIERARIEVLGEPPRVLEVRVDGRARWTNTATGSELSALEGCEDIDVFPSPFTNTFPIRRFDDAEVGRTSVVHVAWIGLPALTLEGAWQEYTLLGRTSKGARWRFHSLQSGFRTDLDVDADGIVRDYPGLARRQL